MQTENNSSKSKKNKLSLVLYIGGSIVALLGAAFLINNISLYNSTVAQYVAAGYDSAEVTSQMFPSQLLPALFEGFGVYGGLSVLLICTGLIFQKVSNFMSQFSLLNQPVIDELNPETVTVAVLETVEVEEILESTDDELPPVSQNISESSADEDLPNESNEQKSTNL